MSEKLAFESFKSIFSLKDIQDKHRAWLKLHEGLMYAHGVEGHYTKGEEWTRQRYADNQFDTSINLVGRLPNQTRIEYDGDEKEAKKFLEITENKLIELGCGYIRSTHNGKSDYLWVEFTRCIKDKEIEAFLTWIAPECSIVDLNFASSKKVFPCLFAVHWKHSYNREIPIIIKEGNQIDFDSLPIKKTIGKKNIKSLEGFDYETFVKAGKIFSGKMELAQRFTKQQPLFYDSAGLWWIWDETKKCWNMTDEIEINNLLYLSCNVNTIDTKERNEIIQALKQVGRMNKPKPLPITWIQFKDKFIDINTLEETEATHEYFAVNPIPYPLHKEKYMETPVMDKLFEEWVGKDHVRTLYEIIAYCLLPDYPIHRLFCFIGAGLNGKSKYFSIIEKFVGCKNICSVELDSLLNSRFEVARLHKKLVCTMGETNFNEMSKTSILKKLTGQDLIGFEYKNKNPFEEHNYAKILISTNNLPETTDKTIGFYRRWMIIDFPNEFSEKEDVMKRIPEEEYEILAVKSVFILKDLLEERKFHKEGTIEDRKKAYEDKSNPLEKFMKENIEEEPNSDISVSEFERKLNSWCKSNRFRELSETFIGRKMKEKGIIQIRPYKEWYENNNLIRRQVRCWSCIKWKI